MGRLKILMVCTSSSEMIGAEAVLQQTGYLDQSRLILSNNLPENATDWSAFDLVCAYERTESSAEVLSFLTEPLQTGSPPVFFFIPAYDARTVLHLTNLGGRRVLPIDDLAHLLPDSLAAVFGPPDLPAAQRLQLLEPSPTGQTLAPDLLRLISAVPVGAAILRAQDGLCLECNQALADLFTRPREALVGRPLVELALTSDIARLLEHTDETLSPAGLEVEHKVYIHERLVKHVLVSINRLDWDGEVSVIALVHDISLQQQAQENAERLKDELERLVLVRTGALEAANRELAAEISRRKAIEEISEQLEQIIWQTPDIVAICNPDGSLRYLNKAGRDMFRINDRLPIGEVTIFQAYSPFFQRKIREEILPYALKHNIWRGEMQVQVAEGQSIPVSQVVLANQENQSEGRYFASIARDISEFKRIEQELHNSREEYRTLAEAAHDYIFVVNADGMMSYANRFACQALNLDIERVVGMSVTRFFPESFSGDMLQMIAEVREIDSAIYTEGYFWQDDRESWLGTWLVPVHNSVGKLTSILGISRDISEQRKTDDALKRALENEKQINQMQSSFFAMTSHQFRTPLSTILLSVEMLEKYSQRWDDDSRMEHYGRIQEAARRLQVMLENILIISRVDSGRYYTQQKSLDLVEFCAQIIKEMSANDREQHPVELIHSSDRLMVCSDPVLLRYILDNLIGNAFKYSPQNSPVIIGVNCESSVITLEVRDQGIGIPEPDQKHLFQPFQRASNTDAYPGTGIGLTIVKKSVELLGGHVFMKSKEGQGTTFQLRFPDGCKENEPL